MTERYGAEGIVTDDEGNITVQWPRDSRVELNPAAFAPKSLPFNWQRDKKHEALLDSSVLCFRGRAGLRVIFSACGERDGNVWVHVSMTRHGSKPTWEDIRNVKDVFLGRENEALQVFPAQSEYVNDHPNCLHLWSCVNGRRCPDFRQDGTI